jgi:predicted AlkP superfamily pyrophosphatase or phosphodiesterase
MINQWNKYKGFLLASLIALLSLSSCARKESLSKGKRIILIGIDGMGLDGFQQAKIPNINELVRQGALSMKTRAVMPTVSAPNWASHLLGAGPEQHGITHNGWTTDNHTVEPSVSDEDGYFPSVFTVIRQQLPNAKTGFFYDWEALSDLYNMKCIGKSEFS